MFVRQRSLPFAVAHAIALLAIPVAICAATRLAHAGDWPMWRCDAQRSAQSKEELPSDLTLWWVADYPELKPAYRAKRLQFDAGYEPVVAGKTLYLASSRNDSVSALDVDNGSERWKFYCDGPVRFAPVASGNRVYFGSDDGFCYCLNAVDGALVWKYQAAPSTRKVLGNGRLISLWPVRGGPVLHEKRLYFAAGVWSFEGVFIYCLDAETGELIWRNDESGFVYGQHPHNAEAFGGVTPQGYLVVNGDELVVPCGQAMPALFDLKTGKLRSFELPSPGRLPGGWFASAELSRAVRRGEVLLDREVNRDLHEGNISQGPGTADVRNKITVGETDFLFDAQKQRVEGEIHSMLAADGKLFIVTVAGSIYCFGEARQEEPQLLQHARRDSLDPAKALTPTVLPPFGLELAPVKRGVALVWGAEIESLQKRLASNQYQYVVLEADPEKVETLRQHFDAQGLYGGRIAIHTEASGEVGLPPYLATIAFIDQAATQRRFQKFDPEKFAFLRPYGGLALLSMSAEQYKVFIADIGRDGPAGFEIERNGTRTIVRRRGALEGAVNYTGGWSSPDDRVRAPLGVLWFDDALGHFKRSPQPWFVDGVMISYPKDWMERHRAQREPPYRLLPPVFSDVYTGRILAADEPAVTQLEFPRRDLNEVQLRQYRPPTQRDDWKPEQPKVGERINPLTGVKEPRAFPKSYGCDGGVDYGNFFTMRSGTPAYYDKRTESGVCNISGPRSGCTNSIIPACGVLNLPYFYEGCTCSYPLPVGLAMVSMPPSHEQWSSWGEGTVEGIQRVGVNLGAPGDRVTEKGTLWLEHPRRGGPSPQVKVALEPAEVEFFYRHSSWLQGGQGWPWVAASGAKGIRALTVQDLKPHKTYSVRLFFLEPDPIEPGQRVFDIAINGGVVRKDFDIAKEAGGSMRSVVIQTDHVPGSDSLRIELTPRIGEPQLSGVEIVATGLSQDEF
ncbi:outer membrane protein assembly factor BamB family protein [Lignipirellula cremea]|uniref:Serine/threonine-protein kinase AfsK n=1 Tax=Lignipirellula cremea TaxID=2528010 RepID=A0A518DW67_9BACT|nr:PQQ-binding-like beta-propeller repeat protein [Lignipirellula cremea]QDU96082.1 Serine/threonine-protein kinase AfsK [Lignipirellula cremea]